MKLFEFKKIRELGEVSKEAIFCFGLYNKEVWLKLGVIKLPSKKLLSYFQFAEIITTLVKGGFYLIINSPFKFKSDYISAIDFIKKNGIIKHRILFSLRKRFCTNGVKDKWFWTYMNVKCPIDDKCEIDCIDPAAPHCKKEILNVDK